MSEQKLREALQKLRSYNVSIAAGQINYRPEDHIAIIDKALQPSTSDEGTPTETPLTDTLFERHVDENRQSTPNAHRALRQVKELLEHARQLERTLHAKERELEKWKADAIGQNDIANRLFAEMEEAQRQLATLQSVSAAPQVKHKVTCKLFPDPYDEREPVGPCTCGAAPQEGKADERIEGRPTAHFEGHEPTGA